MKQSPLESRKIVFQTSRLNAFEFSLDDASALFELNHDPEVVKFTGDPSFGSIENARNFVMNYDSYEKSGMGRWGLRLRNTDEFIGWCGLKLHSSGEIDIGFRLKREYWNAGYATEAATASLRYGFDQFNVEYIIGRSMKENHASIRVLEKVGMKYWKELESDLHAGHCYRILREEFQNS